eukprot:TRINITY_DN180043_c0_g1_i1.p4 TRINITY_DN180043_c0_g1~~TRINITY_DN180043_c0_g1_i1.p4  ORF type:complete len:106 (-),score=5.50 TRINITY_DN180043_c0_g1_i1:16-333(-)
MVDYKNAPQILEHLSKSLTVTVYETRWIPTSAKFVAFGSYPRDTGSIQVFVLEGCDLKLLKEKEKSSSFKCATFGASSLLDRRPATGNFQWMVNVYIRTQVRNRG